MVISTHEAIKANEFLIKVYKEYTNRIFKKIEDPEYKLMLLLDYNIEEIEKIMNDIKIAKKIYHKYLEKNDLESAYKAYQYIMLKSKELEEKIVDKIINAVKIYSIYIAKTKDRVST